MLSTLTCMFDFDTTINNDGSIEKSFKNVLQISYIQLLHWPSRWFYQNQSWKVMTCLVDKNSPLRISDLIHEVQHESISVNVIFTRSFKFISILRISYRFFSYSLAMEYASYANMFYMSVTAICVCSPCGTFVYIIITNNHNSFN